MSEKDVKKFVVAQFVGVYDDEWCKTEEKVVVMLQDKYGMSCEQAEKFVKDCF